MSEFPRDASISLQRLLPRLQAACPELDESDWEVFRNRLDEHFPELFTLLRRLYGDRYDFFFHLEQILTTALHSWHERPADLKGLDAVRESGPRWYQANSVVAAMAYVDRFAGNLEGLQARIPYLKEMGINCLHLMPLFQSPEGENDGGYAISSYRHVDLELGTMEQLAELTAELRGYGISLILDFVFNHTADEHPWARKALDGDPEFIDYYRTFPNRQEPDEYESSLRDIFPLERPGSFTYSTRLRRWVWTTFHSYQWDLNYANPEVFNAMAGEMLFLANQGVEILRLDAVPFLWKRKGSNCENLPEAHMLIQAFNRLARIAAPSTLFLSEAIVAPDEIEKYIGEDECQISYNPLLMALLWEAAATRDVRLLLHSMEKRFEIDEHCTWINYIRSHDDIGWGFANEDAEELGIQAQDHRHFLNHFFIGNHEASFAVGASFQENVATGDARVCGTSASLAGLERAIERDEEEEIELAIRRLTLLHGIITTIGGIPLIYLGDEIGTCNDHDFGRDPEHADDERWIHRPEFSWAKAAKRETPESIEGRVYRAMLRLVRLRRDNFAFDAGRTEFFDTGRREVFGYFRVHPEQTVLCLSNFSEQSVQLDATRLRQLGLRRTLTDIVAGRTIHASKTLELEPLQFMVLVGR